MVSETHPPGYTRQQRHSVVHRFNTDFSVFKTGFNTGFNTGLSVFKTGFNTATGFNTGFSVSKTGFDIYLNLGSQDN